MGTADMFRGVGTSSTLSRRQAMTGGIAIDIIARVDSGGEVALYRNR